MNTKELLANTGFVQGLARTLVMDEHKAADIAQQTYLAALQSASSYTISGATLTLTTASGPLTYGAAVATIQPVTTQ